MEGAKPYKSSMATGLQLSRHQGEPFENPTLYRSIVGSLQYLSFTRPDIAFVVNFGYVSLCKHLLLITGLLSSVLFDISSILSLLALTEAQIHF